VGDWRKKGVREEKEQKDVEKTGDGGSRGRGGESGSKK